MQNVKNLFIVLLGILLVSCATVPTTKPVDLAKVTPCELFDAISKGGDAPLAAFNPQTQTVMVGDVEAGRTRIGDYNDDGVFRVIEETLGDCGSITQVLENKLDPQAPRQILHLSPIIVDFEGTLTVVYIVTTSYQF